VRTAGKDGEVKVKSPLCAVALFAVLSVCTACATPRIVDREYGESYTYSGTTDCTYSGFCYTCMPGWDGKWGCGFKFSSSCSGKEAAKILAQPVIMIYEDGSRRRTTNTRVLEVTGDCK